MCYSAFVIIYKITEGGIFYAKLQHHHRRHPDAPGQLPKQIYYGALQDRLRNREPDHKPLCIKRFISSAAPADVTQRRGKYLLSTEKFAA